MNKKVKIVVTPSETILCIKGFVDIWTDMANGKETIYVTCEIHSPLTVRSLFGNSHHNLFKSRSV